jgi:hypothetical protein
MYRRLAFQLDEVRDCLVQAGEGGVTIDSCEV